MTREIVTGVTIGLIIGALLWAAPNAVGAAAHTFGSMLSLGTSYGG